MTLWRSHGLALVRAAVVTGLIAAVLADDVRAQCCGGGCGGGVRGRRQSVGGVFIDATGMLLNTQSDDRAQLREQRRKALERTPGEMNEPTELRKISLRRLEEAIVEQMQSGKPLSIEMRHLAGLQNIRYVLVYPEENDIVLAGFAEGFQVDPLGAIVGSTTGRPVLMLDDLIVALRTARRAAQGGITCSIDPTPEGLQRLRDYVARISRAEDVSMEQIEKSLGAQQIRVGGVPASSHFARVLVAADYRMKQIGMGHEKAPIPGLPSYLTMVTAGARGMQNMTPRWWMVPSYKPLVTDEDGLAWELRGGTVKTLTEETLFTADGAKSQTGKTSPAAQRWADLMTAKFDDLAAKDSVFGSLRNCMDLAVVAALISHEGLAARAGLAMSVLMDPTQLPAIELEIPKVVPTRANAVPKGSNYVISASGGVEIHPGKIIQKTEPATTSLSPVRRQAETGLAKKSWWWN